MRDLPLDKQFHHLLGNADEAHRHRQQLHAVPQRTGLFWRHAGVEVSQTYPLCDHPDRWRGHAMRVLPQHVGLYFFHDRYGVVNGHA